MYKLHFHPGNAKLPRLMDRLLERPAVRGAFAAEGLAEPYA